VASTTFSERREEKNELVHRVMIGNSINIREEKNMNRTPNLIFFFLKLELAELYVFGRQLCGAISKQKKNSYKLRSQHSHDRFNQHGV
jgi:hypothetical protein